MTGNVFDAEHTATSLIEVVKSQDAVRLEIEEARQLGSPDLPELVREANSAQFAFYGFMQDLDNKPQDELQVIYVLSMKLAVDLMSVMRASAALHNAGNLGAAAMVSIKYVMIVPDHEDAARLVRVAEQRVKSFDGPDDDHGDALNRELEAIAKMHQYYLQPVTTSLIKAIVARQAIASGDSIPNLQG